MKTKMLAVSTLAVIALSVYSCNWFNKSKSTPSLTGKWKVTAISDSVNGVNRFREFNLDSARIELVFITDTTFQFSNSNNPEGVMVQYRINSNKTTIIARANNASKYDTFAIKILTDTLLRAQQGSIFIQLTKQP